MSYINLNIVLNRFTREQLVQLTDDSGQRDIDYDKLNGLIAYVNSFINDNLRSSYKLPLQNNHQILQNIALDILKYELFKRRDAVTEDIAEAYNNSIKILDKIAKKQILLDEGKEHKTYFIYDIKPSLW